MTHVMHLWKDVKLYHGIHEQLQALAAHIDRSEFEISLCILGERCEPIARQFDELKVDVHYLNARSLQNPLLIARLARLFRAVRPDIVQTYCFNANVFGGFAARLAGVPVVISGELTRNDQAPSALRRLRDRLLKPLNDMVSNHASCRVFVSEALREHWCGTRTSAKHRVIHPAFNHRKLLESSGARSESPRMIGIIARLSEEKRHLDLLCAMKSIAGQCDDVRLRVVGQGPLDSQLRAKASELGIQDRVDFVGYVANSFSELKKLSVFVLPSRSEGLPISILEAMAAGVPVVATNVGGIPEQVVDGETGILVSPYNPEQIASAVVYLLRNPAKAREMGEKARARAEEYFSHLRFVRGHEELYRELRRV